MCSSWWCVCIVLHTPTVQVNAGRKTVSSTAGMETTVRTSTLIQHRANVVVPKRMEEMIAAIQKKDFEKFGLLTIQVGDGYRET